MSVGGSPAKPGGGLLTFAATKKPPPALRATSPNVASLLGEETVASLLGEETVASLLGEETRPERARARWLHEIGATFPSPRCPWEEGSVVGSDLFEIVAMESCNGGGFPDGERRPSSGQTFEMDFSR